MLDVNIEKILPVTEVRDSLNKIIDEVEATDELYVVTKNGKPAAIVVGVHHLEKLTGISHDQLMPAEEKTEETAAAPASPDNIGQSPIPEISPADDLFSETPNPADSIIAPPQANSTASADTPPLIINPAPSPDNIAPSAPATTPAIDAAASATPIETTAPAADTSSANDIFATPDNATLNNSSDSFGPSADVVPAVPLNPPVDPNLVPAPVTGSPDANQPENQIPPAAPAQM